VARHPLGPLRVRPARGRRLQVAQNTIIKII
jgi:hypothetical protein